MYIRNGYNREFLPKKSDIILLSQNNTNTKYHDVKTDKSRNLKASKLLDGMILGEIFVIEEILIQARHTLRKKEY